MPALLESAEPGGASGEEAMLVEVRTTSPTSPSTPGIDPGGTARTALRSASTAFTPAHNIDPISDPVEKLRLALSITTWITINSDCN